MESNKKIVFLLIISSLLVLNGCSKKQEIEDIKISDKIEELIQVQLTSIVHNDIESYIKTLDPSKPHYIAEKKSWFRDIVSSNIDDLEIEVIDSKKLNEKEVLVTLNQNYTFNGREYNLVFENKYIKNKDRWFDADLNFNEIETDHFVVKYLDGYEKTAQLAAEGAEEAYDIIIKRIGIKPKDKTVIKIYKDKELLRQSVKLSFAWQFAGWYEYPESIKTLVYDSKDIYKSIIAHELTHKITISVSNNNLPYWFSEGLAEYFTNYYNLNIDSLESYDVIWRWNIKQLENKNLETMTQNDDIRNYYASSGLIVRYISQKYGRDKVVDLVKALGKFTYQEGTGSEVDSIAVKRFEKILPEVLGKTVKQLEEEMEKYIKG